MAGWSSLKGYSWRVTRVIGDLLDQALSRILEVRALNLRTHPHLVSSAGAIDPSTYGL